MRDEGERLPLPSLLSNLQFRFGYRVLNRDVVVSSNTRS